MSDQEGYAKAPPVPAADGQRRSGVVTQLAWMQWSGEVAARSAAWRQVRAKLLACSAVGSTPGSSSVVALPRLIIVPPPTATLAC
jgi:hypothetical protein